MDVGYDGTGCATATGVATGCATAEGILTCRARVGGRACGGGGGADWRNCQREWDARLRWCIKRAAPARKLRQGVQVVIALCVLVGDSAWAVPG